MLSCVSIATPTFFSFPFVWNIFFYPFTFSLCVSFILRWVSWRQHIYGSCFLTHSATLYLLIGAFKPFTLKVIIDRYVFIAIFLKLFSSLFSFSFSSSSLSKFFNICCYTGFVLTNTFNFFLSGKLFISPSILNDNLA